MDRTKTTASVMGAHPCSADFTWDKEAGEPMRCFLTCKDNQERTLIRVEMNSEQVMHLAQAMYQAARQERPAPDISDEL